MKNDNLKFKDIFWNTLGTVTYAAVSLLLSVVIIKFTGSIEGGIFSFGFSTLAHIIYIISFFGMRAMHIVDVSYKYSFYEFRNFNFVCMILAIFVGCIYILVRYCMGVYTLVKSLLLFILVMHGAIDGFADCYESEYQRVNKLYICGQNLFFRILLFTTSLLASLYLTNDLFKSEVIALITELIAFYVLNVLRSKDIFKTTNLGTENQYNYMFKEALPLFLINFLDMFLFSLSKFSIDANLGDVYSGYFNLIFMPTNVIYLVMNLFMKPLLTPLTNSYFNGKDEYYKLLKQILLLAFIISITFIVGTIAFGQIYINVLNLVTNNIYEPIGSTIVYQNFKLEKILLLLVIIGGCSYTLSTPMYYAIIIENKQKYLVIVYIVILLISIYISNAFVVLYGIVGAGIGFSVSMFLLFIGIVIIRALVR